MIFHTDDGVTLHQGDALDVARTLPAGAADCIVTSPPYFGLRDHDTTDSPPGDNMHRTTVTPSRTDVRDGTSCPNCQAKRGAQCVGRGGKPRESNHQERVDRRAAMLPYRGFIDLALAKQAA